MFIPFSAECAGAKTLAHRQDEFAYQEATWRLGKATDFRMMKNLRETEEQGYAAYSAKVIDEAHHPSNVGRMSDPDAYGKVRSWCGDGMEFYLRLNGEKITAAKFMTDGCGPTLASGNTLARLVEGRTLGEAVAVMPGEIVEALGGLPEESAHCAELVVMALQNALFNWRIEHQKRERLEQRG